MEVYGRVVRLGVSPLYFLDEMSQEEVSALLEADMEREKAEWERARMLGFYTIIATNGTKVYKKPADLFKFPWEQKKVAKKKGRTLTKEEFQELADKANKIQDGKKGNISRGQDRR
jgi:hypothetical protein